MAKNKELEDDIQSLATEIRKQATELKGELFLSFSYTADLFNRYLDIELDKRGSSRTRFGILHNLITHFGSMTPTQIAKKVFRSKHAVTRAIDALEKERLVKRGPIHGDRRLRKVNITRKGVNLIEVNMDDRQKMSEGAMSCLSQKQALELNIILKQLRKHLINLIRDSESES